MSGGRIVFRSEVWRGNPGTPEGAKGAWLQLWSFTGRTERGERWAIEVHRTLGPGFLESVYENALGVELRRRAIPYIRQVAVPIVYQGIEVGTHICCSSRINWWWS